jgi:citrate lyase beta subunit
VFTPKPEAIAKAKAIVRRLCRPAGRGRDRPHLTKALRLLARAEAAGM